MVGVMGAKPPLMGDIPGYEFVLTLPNTDKYVTRTLSFYYGTLTESEAMAIRAALAKLYDMEIPMRRYEKDFVEM